MRVVRYRTDEGAPALGVLQGEVVCEALGEAPMALRPGEPVAGLSDVDLLAPVAPAQMVCVGRNYRDHAAEMGKPVGAEPLLFLKPPSALAGPGEPIALPASSSRVDHEAELAVVIGRPAHRVRAEDHASVVWGYTCANDVTARDFQQSDGHWVRGKGFPTFAPLGPWIETDLDPRDVAVRCAVDGQVRQDGRTSDMVFDIPYLVAFVTSFLRLSPGDVIVTGTPAGVGTLAPGQEVAVEIDGVGTLVNPVIAEDEQAVHA